MHMNEITKSDYPCMPQNQDYKYYQEIHQMKFVKNASTKVTCMILLRNTTTTTLIEMLRNKARTCKTPRAIFVDKNNGFQYIGYRGKIY